MYASTVSKASRRTFSRLLTFAGSLRSDERTESLSASVLIATKRSAQTSSMLREKGVIESYESMRSSSRRPAGCGEGCSPSSALTAPPPPMSTTALSSGALLCLKLLPRARDIVFILRNLGLRGLDTSVTSSCATSCATSGATSGATSRATSRATSCATCGVSPSATSSFTSSVSPPDLPLAPTVVSETDCEALDEAPSRLSQLSRLPPPVPERKSPKLSPLSARRALQRRGLELDLLGLELDLLGLK